jgi:ATP-dependent Clp endopeptidase proteolytic subunit ClpP
MSKASSWYSIRTRSATALAAALAASGEAATSGTSAEILIFGDIGESWWAESVTAKDFITELNAIEADAITVRINSAGGSVPDGLAIYNALKRHKAHITTVVEGMAMSIASLILMAGDTVEMAENSLLMIHAPWTYAGGNAVALRDVADMLDKWAQAMSASYAAKTGRPVDEMLTLLTDGEDHYYTASEARAEKLIDSVISAMPVAAMAGGALSPDRYRVLAAKKKAAAATPAAPAAQLEIDPMPQAHNPAGTQPTAIDEAAIRAKALADDAQRRTAIQASFRPFAGRAGVAELEAQCANDTAMTPEAAGQKLLALLAAPAAPLAGAFTAVSTVEDEQDKIRKATTQALAARAGLDKLDGANPVRGDSLLDMARASLVRAGVNMLGLDKMGVVAMAFTHSTSDFSSLLANVASKSMLKGVDEAEETFQLWTVRGELTDFKPAKRVGLNSFGSLPQVREGGEYTYGSMSDRGNEIVLAKYGRRFSITREAIINDDLGAFTRIPRAMGRAAIRTVGDLVYAVLTGNPTMGEDGKALFHADHSNLLTGAAVASNSVDAMRVAMSRQKLPGQGSGSSNIRLQYLLVPVTLQGAASVVRDSEFEVGASSKNNTVPNSVRNTFEVISDARLDDHSTTAWYGAANGNVNDTIEVAYLNGNDRPTLEQQNGWSVDGVEFKVRMEAGVAPLDFRALAKNPGA